MAKTAAAFVSVGEQNALIQQEKLEQKNPTCAEQWNGSVSLRSYV